MLEDDNGSRSCEVKVVIVSVIKQELFQFGILQFSFPSFPTCYSIFLYSLLSEMRLTKELYAYINCRWAQTIG